MKYTIDYTTNFKKQYKKMKKQGKDLNVLHEVVEKLAKGEELETKYKNRLDKLEGKTMSMLIATGLGVMVLLIFAVLLLMNV